jgi:hypothetical protein
MFRTKWISVFLFIAVAAFVFADATSKDWKFKGQIEVRVYTRDQQSKWIDWDRFTASKLSFKCKITAATTSQQTKIETKYDYVGNTLNGIRMRVRLNDVATAMVDPAGAMQMDVPLKVEFGRLNTHFNLKLTTEPMRAPEGGEAKGKRIQFSPGDQTASLALVGASVFVAPTVEDSQSALGQSMSKLTEYLVFVRGEGTLTPEK